MKDVIITEIASDAKETFEYISKNCYDLILMEINLNNCESGIEVMKKIKQIQNYSIVPVIAHTDYSSDKDKNNFLFDGLDGFISRWIKIDEKILEIKLC